MKMKRNVIANGNYHMKPVTISSDGYVEIETHDGKVIHGEMSKNSDSFVWNTWRVYAPVKVNIKRYKISVHYTISFPFEKEKRIVRVKYSR